MSAYMTYMMMNRRGPSNDRPPTKGEIIFSIIVIVVMIVGLVVLIAVGNKLDNPAPVQTEQQVLETCVGKTVASTHRGADGTIVFRFMDGTVVRMTGKKGIDVYTFE